jgi:hypothetical protein
LKKDSTNVEAFNRLVGCQLVTGAQKAELLRGLEFSVEDEWLRKFYEASIKNIDEEKLQPILPNEEPRKETIFETLVQK